MGRKSKRRSRSSKTKAERRAAKKDTLRVTYPSGRSEFIADDGRTLPVGTMVSWDKDVGGGRKEMRWTVIGGGWPFDD